jgi:hypothetical protein
LAEKAQNPKPCLISCSVLIDEINQLKKQGKLDADVVYVSKMFHVDYTILETNLRRVIEKTLPRISGKPVLIYGDLCLGPNGEMKQLAAEYGMVKVDALNCVDCLLGGKGKVNEADPNHDLMFFDPGMIDFFRDAREKLKKEGMDDDALKNMFSGIRGIVLLDTLRNAEKCKADIEALSTGLQILEVKTVGLENLQAVLLEAMQRKPSQDKK